MESIPKNAALIVVDIQNGFDDPYWGNRNNLQAEQNVAKLLEAWRRTKRPVIFARHDSKNPQSPLYPGQKGNDIKEVVKPVSEEPVIPKSVNSAFIGTDLEQRLRKDKIESVVITGITTNHCVSTTARMAGNLGFHTYVVSDGTATFDTKGPDGQHYSADQMHAMGLAEIHNEFATVIDTETLLTRLD